jgi:hypothetical protein
MSDTTQIRELLDAMVAEVLQAHLPALRGEISARALAAMQSLIGTGADALRNAVFMIQEANTQTEILKALLDSAAKFAGRCALFVLRGNMAVGWQARGFRDNDAIKVVSFDPSSGLAARVAQSRTSVSGPVAQFDQRFQAGFGASSDGNCCVLPLMIRGKLAALMYADCGALSDPPRLELAALELLARSASLWVELQALKKATADPSSPAMATARAEAAPSEAYAYAGGGGNSPQMPASAKPLPIAHGAPVANIADGRAAVARGLAGQGINAAIASSSPVGDVQPMPQLVPDVAAGNGAADEDIHRKARRFAKLLVDEIRLYNQDKLKEGKQNRNIYNRLKDDIDKSRATFDKRYANTPAAAGDYFTHELIRGLADNNMALLGSDFPH